MKPIDLTKLLSKFSSGWVALSSDYKKVIAHTSNFSLLIRKLEKVKDEKPILMTISSGEPFSGC